MGRWLVIAWLAGCGRLDFAPIEPAVTLDAAPLGMWSAPTPILKADGVDDPSMTADGLELYVNAGTQIRMAARSDTSSPWPIPTQVTVPGMMYSPHVSADGLTLWGIDAAGGDIVFSTRATRTDAWSSAAVAAGLSSAASEDGPAVTADQLTIVFDSNRAGTQDLYLSTRSAIGQPWAPPVPLTELNTSAAETRPMLAEDGRTLYFQTDGDLAYAVRSDPASAFGPLVPLAELNTPAFEQDPWISDDQRHLVFATDRVTGILSLWETTR